MSMMRLRGMTVVSNGHTGSYNSPPHRFILYHFNTVVCPSCTVTAIATTLFTQ